LPVNIVAVIGGAIPTDVERSKAAELGCLLAEAGFTVICGGGAGVMEAVCSGARSKGGRTIGVIPGTDPSEANQFVETVITTGLGTSRNRMIVLSANAVVAVGGGYGTLSEIAYALQAGRPICVIGKWSAIEGVAAVDTPAEAMEFVTGHTGGD